jgi:hypothetical protein
VKDIFLSLAVSFSLEHNMQRYDLGRNGISYCWFPRAKETARDYLG